MKNQTHRKPSTSNWLFHNPQTNREQNFERERERERRKAGRVSEKKRKMQELDANMFIKELCCVYVAAAAAVVVFFGPMFILAWTKWSASAFDFWLCCCCWFLIFFIPPQEQEIGNFKLFFFSLKSFLVWPNSRIDISWLCLHNLSIEKGCQSKVKSELKNEWMSKLNVKCAILAFVL